LLANPHVQTVLGNLLTGADFPLAARQHHVALADGDQIALHDTQPFSWQGGGPLALLVHGLGGSHQSAYLRRIARDLVANGVRVFRMDLRGCGAGIALAKRFYYAGCSADVRAVIEYLQHALPTSPLVVAGFSLGGNIVLKMAGEGTAAPLPNLRGVVAVAPPIDLVRCSELISRQRFYDAFYARNLTSQVSRHQRLHPDVPRVRFPARTTLRQFDDIYTAPRWGFADSLDYYRRASAEPWVPKIQMPTFILTSRDDPFVAVEPFDNLPPTPHVELHIAPRGGHLGFLGPDGAGGIRWAERRVVAWMLQHGLKTD
jgi:predicted alpha/beta-fold hydrolase